MELKLILEQYIQVSLNLIKSIEEDDDSNGELLIEKREELLLLLENIDFSKEDFKKVATELELVELENKVMETVNKKKENVKRELIELKRQREANRTYGNSLKNVNFINKKI